MKKLFLLVCSTSVSLHAMEKFNEKTLINDLQVKTLVTLASMATTDSDIPHLGAMAVYDFVRKLSDRNHRICTKSKEGLIKNALLNDDETIPDSLKEVMLPIIEGVQSTNWKTEELKPNFPAYEKENNKEEGILDLTNIPISAIKLVEG